MKTIISLVLEVVQIDTDNICRKMSLIEQNIMVLLKIAVEISKI